MGLLEQVAKYGIAFVFGNVLLEQIGLPIPALPTLIVAGALAAQGDLSAPLVLLVAVVACLIADLLWFALGRRQGYRVLNILCRVSLSPDSCVQQTEAFFDTLRPGLAALREVRPGVLDGRAAARRGDRAPRSPRSWPGTPAGRSSGRAAASPRGAIFHRADRPRARRAGSFGSGALVLVGDRARALRRSGSTWQRRRFYRAAPDGADLAAGGLRADRARRSRR